MDSRRVELGLARVPPKRSTSRDVFEVAFVSIQFSKNRRCPVRSASRAFRGAKSQSTPTRGLVNPRRRRSSVAKSIGRSVRRSSSSPVGRFLRARRRPPCPARLLFNRIGRPGIPAALSNFRSVGRRGWRPCRRREPQPAPRTVHSHRTRSPARRRGSRDPARALGRVRLRLSKTATFGRGAGV